MPTTYPLATAGGREPKRARPLAAGVKAAVKALVWGVEGDEGRKPASLAVAAAAGEMRPDTLRRYLHRGDVRGLIADERNAYLAWATSGNAQVLALIRDAGQNEAARVRAVALLEEMAGLRERPGVNVNVGLQANVQTVGYAYAPCDRAPIRPTSTTIEGRPVVERPMPPAMVAYRKHEAEMAAAVEAERQAERARMNPIFKPRP
jgi:hypothetical protein